MPENDELPPDFEPVEASPLPPEAAPPEQWKDDAPPRPIPWVSTPSNVATQERVRPADGQRFIRVFIDTGTARVATDWTPDELAALAQALYRQATGGLTIADGTDLAALKDASPFEQAVDKARRRGKL